VGVTLTAQPGQFGGGAWLAQGAIASKGALIRNPPSARAVAKRDAPQVAEGCWTFRDSRGAELLYLSQRKAVESMAYALADYDIRASPSCNDLKIWDTVAPPKGTIYNYPIRPWHDAEYYITGSSGPPESSVRVWNRGVIPGMVSRLVAGQAIKESMHWAKGELEGFTALIGGPGGVANAP
jgi:hypothetical protein